MSVPAEETARHRALLDTRSAALAAQGQAERQDGARRNFLVCALGTERYGLPVEAVAAVLPERPCTVLPGAGASLRGIIAHAGEIVTVIDPGPLLGLPAQDGADGAGEPRHLVRLRADPPTALLFDRVLGLASLAADRIAARADAAGSEPATDLGTDPVSGYAAAASAEGTGDGFAVLDPASLVAPLMAPLLAPHLS